jgi:squalene-hopene/tetraprenyl-beta-curcumene cyclase
MAELHTVGADAGGAGAGAGGAGGAETGLSAAARNAADEAAAALLARRRNDGSWQDYLPSAAISTASSVVALHFADPHRSAGLIAAGLDWLRRTQLPGGGWGDAPGQPGTLTHTAFAVGALKFLAQDEAAGDWRLGLDWINSNGGTAAVADPKRCGLHALCLQWLALAGLYEQDAIRRVPAVIALLPRRTRRKVSFVMPVLLSWLVMQRRTRQLSWPVRQLFRLAEPRALAYFDELIEYEPPDGGSQESPLLVSLNTFAFARVGVRPDLVSRGVAYLRNTARADGSWPINRDLEFSATAFATMGLQDGGLTAKLESTQAWIRSCQWRRAFPATGCPPGAWTWSADSGWPNSDDTASGLITLHGFGFDDQDPQVALGVSWLLSMQNSNGSWSCFCRNNHVALDAPCAVMTSHVITALRLAAGLTSADEPVGRAVRWLGRVQRADGSVPCLWYRGDTAGTAAALEALAGLGLGNQGTAGRCRQWLLRQQNADGGWGDGHGAGSTSEETAWALTALLAAGEQPGSGGNGGADGGALWLASHRRPDGLWEPTVLGVYFLDLWYSDDILAAGYALQALNRYLEVSERGVEADREDA